MGGFVRQCVYKIKDSNEEQICMAGEINGQDGNKEATENWSL